MKVANYIQLARTQMHLTQEYLAENIGVSRQAISRWENGQAQPSARNMVKIAALLNVSVDQLTGAAPLESPAPAASGTSSLTEDLMESWNDLFQRTMGVDLSRYASEHIRQTVQLYMQQHDLRSVSAFIRLMSASKERRLEFLHAIQPATPTFFDDPALFRYLQEELLPRIHISGTPIRVWVSAHPPDRRPSLWPWRLQNIKSTAIVRTVHASLRPMPLIWKNPQNEATDFSLRSRLRPSRKPCVKNT